MIAAMNASPTNCCETYLFPLLLQSSPNNNADDQLNPIAHDGAHVGVQAAAHAAVVDSSH